MVVDFVDVLFHFAGQRWSNFSTAGFASQMCSISVKLCFKIDKHRTTRSELVIGDSLLKFCVALVHFGVECSGVKFLPGYGKLVDEREVKTAEALYGGIASAFRERRGAATRNENRGGTEQNISRHKRRFHMRSFKSPILRRLASTCQDWKSAASPGSGRVFPPNEEQVSLHPDSTANRGDGPPFCSQRPTSQRLMPHRDSATRRRSHFLRRPFRQLLRGVESDNARAFDARDSLRPFPECREFWQMLNTTRLAGPQ